MKAKRVRFSVMLGAAALLVGTLSAVNPASATGACTDAASAGCWSSPFSRLGQWDAAPPATPADSVAADPAAASMVVLPNGQILYWNGLQNLENCSDFSGFDFGACAGNSKSQMLDLTGSGTVQNNFSAVATNTGDDLFCSDQRLLADGRVVSAGGTRWEQEVDTRPYTGGNPAGVVELYGSKNTHVFGNSWGQVSDMKHGRWYPTLLTMPDGKLFVAGGTSKLLWNSSLLDPRASEPYPANVVQTETLDPATGTWSDNATSADITLPQFARMHVLPNGEIFYGGAGQMWGPAGETVDQAQWNFQKIYDPATKSWRTSGLAAFGARSGTFSAMLPLTPNGSGQYNKAQFVMGGGVLGTSPGSWLANNLSEVVTVAPDGSGTWASSSERTGDMANRRWYSSAVVLPNSEVLAFSGANIDEVVLPGIESAIHQAEVFNPVTKTWTGLSMAGRDRTYHNSALLLADGSVLVGGHAPINQFLGGRGAANNNANGFSNNLKDPSFERFYPPYLYNGARPKILSSSAGAAWGSDLNVTLASGSEAPTKFELVRLPSVTHTTDADNRTVEVTFDRTGDSVKVHVPGSASVLPPGFYYLFGLSADGTPSVAPIVRIAAGGAAGTVSPLSLINTPLR